MIENIEVGKTYVTFCGTFTVTFIHPNGKCDLVTSSGSKLGWHESKIREALAYEQVRHDAAGLEEYNTMCQTGIGIEEYKQKNGL